MARFDAGRGLCKEEVVMTLAEAACAVWRVVEHPYTTEVGERARFACLIGHLSELECSPRELAGDLGAMVALPGEVPAAHLGVLIDWVASQREWWLKKAKVVREAVPAEMVFNRRSFKVPAAGPKRKVGMGKREAGNGTA